MAGGKWISDLTPGTPLADAARRVLAVRLEVVRDYLGLALHEPDKDVEYVHQLRVGTRRAGAALEIFGLCLPDKVYRKARKKLRRLRRAAGAARDWDVFLEALATEGEAPARRHRAGLDFLIGYALGQRVLAQGQLETAGQDYPFAFERFLAETLAAVTRSEPGPAIFLDLARPLLLSLLKELDEAAIQDLNDYDHLHRVRIIGKRLRYAMEVFADCFTSPFRDRLYPEVEEMQEILGRANDSHVASQRLTGVRDKLQATLPAEWKRYKPGIDGLIHFHQERLPKERQAFLEWWERWQKVGCEAGFIGLLKTAG